MRLFLYQKYLNFANLVQHEYAKSASYSQPTGTQPHVNKYIIGGGGPQQDPTPQAQHIEYMGMVGIVSNQHEVLHFAITVEPNNNIIGNAMRTDDSRDRHEGYANSMHTTES